MLILNTGGTFNKRYNPLKGELEVPYDNDALDSITSRFTYPLNLAGTVYKDSLEIDAEDRKMMADIILASTEKTFILVHGTDTMDKTAAFLAEVAPEKIIIITGAMVPFSIDPIEATANFAMALGFGEACEKEGVYICMQGSVAPHDKLVKNRSIGKFERV